MLNITPDTLRNPTTPERNVSALETTLLVSSPLIRTDIRKANEELLETVRKARNLPSPAKRYIGRLTSTLERANSERALLRKENEEQRELLQYRKKHIKGKRVAIKGKFVFNTREILEIVEKAEAEASTKKARKRRRTKSPTLELEDKEEEILENLESDGESDCIIVASRR